MKNPSIYSEKVEQANDCQQEPGSLSKTDQVGGEGDGNKSWMALLNVGKTGGAKHLWQNKNSSKSIKIITHLMKYVPLYLENMI